MLGSQQPFWVGLCPLVGLSSHFECATARSSRQKVNVQNVSPN